MSPCRAKGFLRVTMIPSLNPTSAHIVSNLRNKPQVAILCTVASEKRPADRAWLLMRVTGVYSPQIAVAGRRITPTCRCSPTRGSIATWRTSHNCRQPHRPRTVQRPLNARSTSIQRPCNPNSPPLNPHHPLRADSCRFVDTPALGKSRPAAVYRSTGSIMPLWS